MHKNTKKKLGETLLFVHNKGYLHNDLKGNNVVLDRANHNPVLIDFGKSKRILQARLLKPKVNIWGVEMLPTHSPWIASWW